MEWLILGYLPFTVYLGPIVDITGAETEGKISKADVFSTAFQIQFSKLQKFNTTKFESSELRSIKYIGKHLVYGLFKNYYINIFTAIWT